MRRLIRNFLNDEAGATAIEYCLIAAGIAMAIVVTVQTTGISLGGRYAAVNTALQ